jgi:asparagine synthase (glutamine-hydrolysing)
MEPSLRAPKHGHFWWNRTFSRVEEQSLIRQPLSSAFQHLLVEMDDLPKNAGALLRLLWFGQKYTPANAIPVKSGRISVAHSVAVRPPLRKHRIVQFAYHSWA